MSDGRIEHGQAVTPSLVRRFTAWSPVVLTVALVMAGAALATWNLETFILAPAVLTFAVVGALVTSRRPGNLIGPLLLAVGLAAAASAIVGGAWAMAQPPLQGQEWGALLESVGSSLWIVPLMLVLFRFPDGRPLSHGWQRVERLALLNFALLFLVGLLFPFGDEPNELRNPLGIEALRGVLDPVAGILWVLSPFAIIGGAASFVVRYRRSRGADRAQMKEVVFASALIGVGFLTITASYWFLDAPLDDPDQGLVAALVTLPFIAGLLFFPMAVGIGILRYRLFDIDVVMKKTVVFAILVVLLMAVAIAIFSAASSPLTDLAPDETQAVDLAGLVLGLLVWPLYRLARRIGDRVVYRGRASPYEVLTKFSDRMSVAYATDDVLARLAAVLGEGTGAESAVVWLRVVNDLRPESVWPAGVKAPSKVPDDAVKVIHQGESLGALSVEMPANDPMSPTKEKIVRDLAGQAGLVLRNVRLIEELRESRRRLVTAQDEERRKLERNIHDGAQQQLLALGVKVGLLERLAGDDLKVRQLAAELRGDAQVALEDLRDLARGIYPPLLADKGLAAALESQARKASIPVTVEPDGIGRYLQEVESAVYFSVLEALQNVAKHAEASHASVRLAESDGDLAFEVVDDGVGFDPAAAGYGTGLQGMADRLAALGGLLTVTSQPGRGTTVTGSVSVRGAETGS